jgi:hypothetical protein
MNRATVIGWIIQLAGTALWLVGYLTTGNPPLVDWQASAPWWIAHALPNIQSEIGMVLAIAGMALIYWPRPHR